MEIDVKKILELNLKLNNLLEGFDEFYLNKKFNLTIKDKILVCLISKNLSPFELIKNISIAKSNLALALSDMEKKGLVVKKKDEIDKRNIVISLTANGKVKANEVLNALNKNINSTLAYKNNAEEINKLVELLNDKIS